MHDVADSPSNNYHLPAIRFAHTYDATQSPVSKVCVVFKNSKAKRMRDLRDTIQRKPVLSIEIAVLNFIKECIHPIKTHCTPVNGKTIRPTKSSIYNRQGM